MIMIMAMTLLTLGDYGSDYENKSNYYQADPFVYTVDKEIIISDGIYEI